VVVERSGYGDWSALAWRSGCAWRFVEAAPTDKSGLRRATALQQWPAALYPGAVIKQRTQGVT
jgi:hypothetical protein